MTPTNLLSATDLISQLNNPNLIILDSRFTIDNPARGFDVFVESHIIGANYLSVNNDLSTEVRMNGGRHPLPTVEAMAKLFGSFGIMRNVHHVVVYDDSGGSIAGRLWWMLRYLGHQNVQLLDGGFQAYCRAGGHLTSAVTKRTAVTFLPDVKEEMLVSMRDVQNLRYQVPLIDARAPERFNGKSETLDVKAGHIPGALNLWWKDNLNEDLTFKEITLLRDRFTSFQNEPVMYCGSGVTACLNILAMEEAGYAMPRLYAGSWSDWISYEDNPIEG